MFLPALAPASTAFALAFAPAAFQQPPPAPPAPASAAPAATKYEFPTDLAPGESHLIEIRTSCSSVSRAEIAGESKEFKSRDETTTWVVDTLLDPATQPKDHVWTGRRRFVKVQSTKDGVVDDPESNGFEASIWVDTTRHIHFDSATERLMSLSTMQGLLPSAEAFGLGAGVPLPASAAVGDEFEMRFATLAPWCLTTEGATPKANAKIRFESVDPKKSLARFKGPVHVEESFEKSAEELDLPFGMKGNGAYDGDVEIDYDIAAHRVTRIVCRAKAEMRGEIVGKVAAQMIGNVVIESTITCSVGAPAASALNQKPQFRDVPHEISKSGISIALPSHFFKVPSTMANATTYRSVLQGDASFSRILIVPIEEAASSVKEVGEGFRAGFSATKGTGTIKEAKASGGLGSASAYEISKDGEHGLAAIFMVSPNHFVLVQCSCAEALWTERSKEFPRFLQTLKKLPAAK